MFIDGNQAAAHAAFAFSEIIPVYPITPSTGMMEYTLELIKRRKLNIFENIPIVKQMQSESGVAGTLHGILDSGKLTTTFTSSQGLLLMIPELYKMATSGVPGVIHVANRSIVRHVGTMFNDHSDIQSIRQTGVAMICSRNPQEAHDMAVVAHMAAIEGEIFTIHFFEGFQVSHRISMIKTLDKYDGLINHSHVKKFRSRRMTSSNPTSRGVPMNFGCSKFLIRHRHEQFPDVVEKCMKKFSDMTGREYHPFELVTPGTSRVDTVYVMMGTLSHEIEIPENVAIINVRLYRPFSSKQFLECLNSIKSHIRNIVVFDKCYEPGSSPPLYLEVLNAVISNTTLVSTRPNITSVIYGLMGDSDFMINEKTTHDQTHDFKLKKHHKIMVLGKGGDFTISKIKSKLPELSTRFRNLSMDVIFEPKKTNGYTITSLMSPDITRTTLFVVNKTERIPNLEYDECLNIHGVDEIMNVVSCLNKEPIIKQKKLETNKMIDAVINPYGIFPTDTPPVRMFSAPNNLVWNPEKCSACGRCSFMCPQSCITCELSDAKFKFAPHAKKFKLKINNEMCLRCGLCNCKAIQPGDSSYDGPDFKILTKLPTTELFNLQFKKSYMSFPGCCAGCNEAIYVKILCQLFGKNIIIANATGCSMIWSSMYPNSAFRHDGGCHRGPAWSNSLFEDNAEYAYGIDLGVRNHSENVWAVGGDGAMYDIGFGGLDHIMNDKTSRVRVLVLNNRSYANTGFQVCKSQSKDLGLELLMSGNYHAFISNVNLKYKNHAIETFKLANAHKGPSIIIADCQCPSRPKNIPIDIWTYNPVNDFPLKLIHKPSGISKIALECLSKIKKFI